MSPPTPTPEYNTIAVIAELSDKSRAKIANAFRTVHYYPDGQIPRELLADVDVWFTRILGIPQHVRFEDIPRTKILQLSSAGANKALATPALLPAAARRQIAVCGSSGIHSQTIPQYIIGQIINVYMNLHTAIYLHRTQKRWATRDQLRYHPDRVVPHGNGFTIGFHELRGQTAGLLGYGHIARETARLLRAFGVNVIAANSTGGQRADDGYIIPGTGDKEGSIPSAYYSTADPASFDEFLSKSNILIASLPSTPATRGLLTLESFKKLPEDAVFVNVGRGDLATSDDILAALDGRHLLAAALDVTDPEPLPDGHPLFTHPRAVVTPHVASDTPHYFDYATDLLLFNIERIRAGGQPVNRIDPEKGY